jgi:hypothetical protein
MYRPVEVDDAVIIARTTTGALKLSAPLLDAYRQGTPRETCRADRVADDHRRRLLEMSGLAAAGLSASEVERWRRAGCRSAPGGLE